MIKIKKIFTYIKPILNPKVFVLSLIFNLKYLPLHQAIFLPIWVKKPYFQNLKGKVILKVDGGGGLRA